MTRALCSLIVLLLVVSGPARAQPADEVMDRVAEYVHHFVEKFANVVAEEDYVPLREYGPRMRSDYLLVQHPSSPGTWLTFRDVVALNGSSLRNQPERLMKLFLEPFDNAVKQANAITEHSTRYVSPRIDPLLGIALLQRQYQRRFKYTLGDLDRKIGVGVRRIKFEETATPTILRDGNADQPTRGTVWAVEATGRVVRTELEILEIGLATRAQRWLTLSTTFKRDETLGIDVPATMQEGRTVKDGSAIHANAYYAKFRRFTVRTVEAIDTPKP